MHDRNVGLPAYLKDHIPPAQSTGNEEEDNCPAFGFLRGLDARALAVEFRLLTGNSEWFSYSCLVSWRHNPSVGLLLKFNTGDVTSLVLILGSNLDVLVTQSQVNLTDRGLQRHRIVYIREMDEDALTKAKKGEPSIDRIEIAEFETVAEQREWLKKLAPAFGRNPT